MARTENDEGGEK